MDKSIDIKSKLEEIQARPVGLPAQITPQQAASLIREREILLKIAIVLEEQNQYLLNKYETPLPLQDESLVQPVKKEDFMEALGRKSHSGS